MSRELVHVMFPATKGEIMAPDDDGEISYDEEKEFFNQEIANFLGEIQDALDELRGGADDDRTAELQLQLSGSFNNWSRRVTPQFFAQFPEVKPLPSGWLQQIFDDVGKLPVKVWPEPDLHKRKLNLQLKW
jgi:hypothetical protein